MNETVVDATQHREWAFRRVAARHDTMGCQAVGEEPTFAGEYSSIERGVDGQRDERRC